MNDQITSLFAFLNSSRVKEKYNQFRRGSTCCTGCAAENQNGYKIRDDEIEEICKRYKKGETVAKIASKIGRSSMTVSRALKKKGIYDVNRDINKGVQFTPVKTQKA